MYNLAIIDDEKLARQFIISQLSSSELSFASVIQAECGSDALQKFSSTVPDIMLVDIKMPDIDGLSLIKVVQERINPFVKVIIISGYDDFQYSRKAIHLGVNDYLLKPIRKADLHSSIENAIQELKNSKYTGIACNLKNKLIQENLLNDFLDGKCHQLDKIIKIIHSDYVHVDTDSSDLIYLSLVVKIIHHNTPVKNKNEVLDNSLLCNIFKNVIDKYLTSMCSSVMFKRTDYKYVAFIIIERVYFERLNYIFTMLLKEINNLNYNVSIGVGKAQKQLEFLTESYKQALVAANQFLFQNSDYIYYFDRLYKNNALLNKNLTEIEKDIINFIAIGNTDYKLHLRPLLDASMFNNYIEYEKFLDNLVLSLQKLANRRNISIDIISDINNTKNKCCSLQEIKNKIFSIVDSIFIFQNDQCYNTNLLCSFKKVLNYIDENYQCDDLSYERLSYLIHMSQPYFCRVFKNITGKNFVKYVNDLRIEKAKDLLENSSLKVYEIAQNVGFTNVNYFYRLFKKYTSLEPLKYRRQSNDKDV